MKPIVLCSTKDMPRVDWLKMRQLGIGGSDVGAICGVNPWKGAISVYLDKTTEIKPVEEDDADNEMDQVEERLYWGHVQEDVVAKEFLARESRKVPGLKIKRQNKMFQHPTHYFMLANIDRLIFRPDMGYGVLECKTASEYAKQEWEGEGIPGSYYLQVQHYLAVMDLQYAYIAVLIGGNKFRYKFIQRDDDLINNIIQVESNFWNGNVLKQSPPAVDGSEDAGKMLLDMYPQSNPEITIELNDMGDKVQRIWQIDQEVDTLEVEKEKLKQEIQEKMQDAEKATVVVDGKTIKVTWKTQITNRVDGKLLKKELPDIYEQYLKPSPSRPFKIAG